MAKISKELKQEQQIAEGLATIKEARESVDALAAQYNDWIDQAAELGEDEYSDQSKWSSKCFPAICSLLKCKFAKMP